MRQKVEIAKLSDYFDSMGNFKLAQYADNLIRLSFDLETKAPYGETHEQHFKDFAQHNKLKKITSEQSMNTGKSEALFMLPNGDLYMLPGTHESALVSYANFKGNIPERDIKSMGIHKFANMLFGGCNRLYYSHYNNTLHADLFVVTPQVLSSLLFAIKGILPEDVVIQRDGMHRSYPAKKVFEMLRAKLAEKQDNKDYLLEKTNTNEKTIEPDKNYVDYLDRRRLEENFPGEENEPLRKMYERSAGLKV